MSRIAFILIFFNSIIGLQSQIITVKQDSTGNFISIQEAINASNDGDTVLVWPGRYYENVDFNGKNISLGSLFITTGDPAYLLQTVIDGNENGSCIIIVSGEMNILISGFTIENGYSDRGGGIYLENSGGNIDHCVIQDNFAHTAGGGICSLGSYTVLSSNIIRYNHAYRYGGGIMMSWGINVDFDSVALNNIYLNFCPKGAEICKGNECPPLYINIDTFTVIQPDVYHLYSYLSPGGMHQNDITYNILHGKIEQVNADLYVSPEGDNDNPGTSSDQPLKNISFALSKITSDSLHPNTIHLANGTYSPSVEEKYPLGLRSYISLHGQSRDSTILDAENTIYHMHGNMFTNDFSIKHITFKGGRDNGYDIQEGVMYIEESCGALYEDLLFTENYGESGGVGLISRSNGSIMRNCKVHHNFSGNSALFIGSWDYPGFPPFIPDTFQIMNCTFSENQPDTNYEDGGGGALHFLAMYDDPGIFTAYVMNCEFYDNYVRDYPPYTGANALGLIFGAEAYLINSTFGNNEKLSYENANVGVTYNSTLHIYNSILYNNWPAELYMFSLPSEIDDTCHLNIYNSLIMGGEEDIRIVTPKNVLYYDPTNIDTDPLWDTNSMFPYSLSEGSPCIDAGTLNLPPGITLPEYDIAGNPRIWGETVDMGAYEYGPWVGVKEDRSQKTEVRRFLEISPNPFSYGTYISYEATEKGMLNISVYNISGMKVRSLINSFVSVGDKGNFYWDGSEENKNELPAGAYIIRLTINGKLAEAVKVVKE
jgi:hypothetical protein